MSSHSALSSTSRPGSATLTPLVVVRTWWEHVSGPVLTPLLDHLPAELGERHRLDERTRNCVPVERIGARSRPAHLLVEPSEHAQLVVIGSRGRHEFAAPRPCPVRSGLVHRTARPAAIPVVIPVVSVGASEAGASHAP